MNTLAPTILLAAVVLAAAVLLARTLRGRPRRDNSDAWPVYAKRVLNEREQVLYQRLRRAYPQQVVLARVALSQLVGTQRGPNSQAVYNRYSRLVADFVLCAPDFTPLAVFELDGRSHDDPKRQDADARKAGVLHAAGVALIRLNSRAPNDEADLHAAFPPPHTPAPPTAAVAPRGAVPRRRA